MSYEHTISEVVKVIEAIGAGIMVIGGLGSFVGFAAQTVGAKTAQKSYDGLRRNLGFPGVIVIIRILLSFALEVEIDGVWPWRRWQLAAMRTA
jgi:uncharacterized membrane protein